MFNFNKYTESKIPFLEKGRSDAGLDCWGLVRIFYKNEMGVDLPSYDEYENTKDAKISETIKTESKEKWDIVENPRDGDVVICRMRGRPMHAGIFKEPYFMLHIEEGSTPKIEKLNGLKWKNRIIGYYRLRSFQ